MLYAILCYNDEAVTTSWTQEEDDAVMAKLQVVHDQLYADKLLGPSIRLMPTTTATTTTTNELHSNYASLPRRPPMNGNYEFVERMAPEGAAAASVQAIDHGKGVVAPGSVPMPSAAGAIVPIQTGPQPQQQPIVAAGTNPASNVFYAMNV